VYEEGIILPLYLSAISGQAISAKELGRGYDLYFDWRPLIAGFNFPR
jgi:hypothetical protein